MPRLLLLRFHSLGDVVLTTGIVRALAGANHRPGGEGTEIEVVTDLAYRPVFDGLSQITRLWTREEWKAADSHRSYDAVIDLQGTPGSRQLARGMGPVHTIATRAFRRRWLVFWGDRFPRPHIPSAVKRYAEAAGLEGSAMDLSPMVRVTEADESLARGVAPEAFERQSGAVVALLTGAARRSKEWPASRFLSLARKLRTEGITVWWLAPPEDDRRPRASKPRRRDVEEIEAEWEREGILWRLPLSALKAVLARASMAVANDSGPMHLAAALGLPVAALFGSSVPAFGFTPFGEGHTVLNASEIACRPCGVHGRDRCWLGHWRCLRDLDVEAVLPVVLRTLRLDKRRDHSDSGIPGRLPSAPSGERR